MTRRQKARAGVFVGGGVAISPAVADAALLGNPAVMGIMLVPIGAIAYALLTARSRTEFWVTAVPTLLVLILAFAYLRVRRLIGSEVDPFDLLMPPVYGVIAFFLGKAIGAVFTLLSRSSGNEDSPGFWKRERMLPGQSAVEGTAETYWVLKLIHPPSAAAMALGAISAGYAAWWWSVGNGLTTALLTTAAAAFVGAWAGLLLYWLLRMIASISGDD